MEYTNSQIEHLIDEYIHNKRYREALKLHFIDGETIEAIAEKIDRSPRQVANIISRCSAALEKRL